VSYKQKTKNASISQLSLYWKPLVVKTIGPLWNVDVSVLFQKKKT
jgi:hypothetical protein